MSDTNISTVQHCYAAFARGDVAAIVAATAGDVDWTVNGRSADFPTIGSWKGAAGVRSFFASVAENVEFAEFNPAEFHASKDKVIVLGHYAGRVTKTKCPIASDFVHVFTFKDGRITAFREFTDTAQFAAAYRGQP
jgi:ketosteroid isomerase-like protein